MTSRTCLLIAGIAGSTAVLAGTFAAHGLEERLAPDLLEVYTVGARYHAYHALALLACVGFIDRLGRGGSIAVWCFAMGTAVFAGSLYALAVSGQRWWGAITPIGGVCFLAGWCTLIVTAVRSTGRPAG